MVTRTKKIFVGGLSAPSTLDDVKAYFEQFGRVSNLNLYMNKYFISQTNFVLCIPSILSITIFITDLFYGNG